MTKEKKLLKKEYKNTSSIYKNYNLYLYSNILFVDIYNQITERRSFQAERKPRGKGPGLNRTKQNGLNYYQNSRIY